MQKRIAVAVLFFSLLSGCFDSAPMSQAKDLIRAVAVDPSSLKFGKVTDYKSAVCGVFSGKDKYGRQSDSYLFVYLPEHQLGEVTIEGEAGKVLSGVDLNKPFSKSYSASKLSTQVSTTFGVGTVAYLEDAYCH